MVRSLRTRHRAATLYDLLRDREKAARVLLNLRTLHLRRHEPAAAVATDRQALALLEMEAVQTFAEQRVERETQAALELLEAAARRDAVTREVLEKTIEALEGNARER